MNKNCDLPTLGDVLYEEPLPSEEGKTCANCCLYVSGNLQCVIHDPNLQIYPDAVCGYHVSGEPMAAGTSGKIKVSLPVLPKYSGLTRAPQGGTACDSCTFYEPRSDTAGVCHGTQWRGWPGRVSAAGCCARWRKFQ